MPPHQSNYEIDEVSVEYRSSLTIDDFQKDEVCNSVVSPLLSRRVSFAEHPQVRTVMSHEEYTFMERKSSWRSPYESLQSKILFEKVVSRIQQGKPCKSDMTYRGLEQWRPSGDQGLHKSSREIVKAVLNEQNRQGKLECCDPEAIASISASISEKCRLRALELANDDEREAQIIFKAETAKCKPAPTGRRSWWTLGMSRQRA